MREIVAETAREAISLLRPTEKDWTEGGLAKRKGATWFFRGQACSTWGLVPSRLRLPSDDIESATAKSNWDVLENEVRDVQNFLRLADEHLLLTEPYTSGMQPALNNLLRNNRERFSQGDCADLASSLRSTEVLRSFALAQHHGIPTRLLDWSPNPLVGLFFAAESVLDEENVEESAVWCLSYGAIAGPMPSDLRLVETPRHGNEFAARQRGVFTIDAHADIKLDESGMWRPQEQTVIEHESVVAETMFGEREMLRKLTFPSACAEELLELLEIEGISRLALMPSLDNAALATKRIAEERVQPKVHAEVFLPDVIDAVNAIGGTVRISGGNLSIDTSLTPPPAGDIQVDAHATEEPDG